MSGSLPHWTCSAGFSQKSGARLSSHDLISYGMSYLCCQASGRRLTRSEELERRRSARPTWTVVDDEPTPTDLQAHGLIGPAEHLCQAAGIQPHHCGHPRVPRPCNHVTADTALAARPQHRKPTVAQPGRNSSSPAGKLRAYQHSSEACRW